MARARRSRPLRGQVRAAILAATAGALLVFAVPLAIALRTAYVEQAETVLQREAAAVMRPGLDAPTLLDGTAPTSSDPTVHLTIYRADGTRASGPGRDHSSVAADVASSGGGERTYSEGDMLAAYLPVGDEGSSVAVIRAAMDVRTVQDRYTRAWALMGMLGLAILLLAYWAAGRLARRLSAPLEGLAESAVTLGAGGFGLQVPRTGVQEVDVVGAVLEDSGRRLGERFQRERAFSADASHQLRTPITALRLTLEGAEVDPTADLTTVTDEALTQVDRLERTVEDLLALARDLPTPAEPVWVGAVVVSLRERYRTALGTRGRSLEVEVGDGLPPAAFPEAALRQILDVLVDNALVHGSGTVTVRARTGGTGLSVVVDDEGLLPEGDPEAMFHRRSPAARGTGIGLALARSLAEAEGARLLAGRYEGGTRFTLVMAEWEPRRTRERAPA
jgi:signal transduction histidine kinase